MEDSLKERQDGNSEENGMRYVAEEEGYGEMNCKAAKEVGEQYEKLNIRMRKVSVKRSLWEEKIRLQQTLYNEQQFNPLLLLPHPTPDTQALMHY